MKKRYLILSISLWLLVAVLGIGAIIYGVGGGFSKMTTGVLVKEESIALGSIRSIEVSSTYQSVEIRKTTDDHIKISQYGHDDLSGDELFSVSTSDGSVRIYMTGKWHFRIMNFIDDTLIIEIPENFSGDLDAETSSGSMKVIDEFQWTTAALKSSSGDIHIYDHLTADSLYAKTSSGAIRAEGNIRSNGDVSFKSSSGDIRLGGTVTAKNLNAETSTGAIRFQASVDMTENITLKSSSGSIRLDGEIQAAKLQATVNSGGIGLGSVAVESFYLESSSGTINADSISGGGEAKTTSGGIRLTLKDPGDSVNLNATSGDIRVWLESSLQFTLEAQTTSGGIHTNFATEKNEKGNKATAIIGDHPTVQIIAHASYGGIRIEQSE